MSDEYRRLLIGTILSWSFGFFGADRFYKNEIGLGVLKLFTFGGIGVWWLIDAINWTRKLGQA